MAIHSAKQLSEQIDVENIDVQQVLRLGVPELQDSGTSAFGNISLVLPVTLFDTTAGASTSTLPNGQPNQVKILSELVRGGSNDMVVTITTGRSSTITFDAANEYWVGIFRAGQWETLITNATLA